MMRRPMSHSILFSLAVLAIASGLGACASRQADVRDTAADPQSKSGPPIARVGALSDGFDAARLSPEPPPAASATVYTCPMHPEVTSDKPGKCPKCGMDLVPKSGSNEHDHHHGTP